MWANGANFTHMFAEIIIVIYDNLCKVLNVRFEINIKNIISNWGKERKETVRKTVGFFMKYS